MSDDSRFGGSLGTPAGTRAVSPPVAPTQQGQFGSPPPPPGQFGSPPPPPPAMYGGAPAYGQGPYPPVQRKGPPVWAIVAICVPVVLIVLGFLAAIAIPVFLAQRNTPVMPDSVGGVARSTDPTMSAAVDRLRKQLSDQNPRQKIGAAGYGSLNGGYVLIGMSGSVRGEREFSDFGVTEPVQSFGEVQCGTSPNNGTMCLQTGLRGTLELVQLDGGAGLDLTRLAVATHTAWIAQPFGH